MACVSWNPYEWLTIADSESAKIAYEIANARFTCGQLLPWGRNIQHPWAGLGQQAVVPRALVLETSSWVPCKPPLATRTIWCLGAKVVQCKAAALRWSCLWRVQGLAALRA